MDPVTLALATFGIQKLRGKSTKRSFRDALIVGGIGQLGSMTGAGQQMGLTGFGHGAGQLGAGGLGIKQQLANTQAAQWAGSAWGNKAVAGVEQSGTKMGGDFIAAQAPQAATGIQGWSPATKLGAGLGLATLMEGKEDMPNPPFTEQDYKDAYAKQSKLTAGLGESFNYPEQTSMYYGGPSTKDIYAYKHGGLASIQKFATGGVSYLPSKIDHDEKDTNNYIRATGQIADGAGAGDKNKDTILAQLADGEFVSRSDAILGAGLIEGASPTSEEDMRKKGAAFFYSQQAKFKRIFDLLDASKKTKH